jgi:hypothetical protein
MNERSKSYLIITQALFIVLLLTYLLSSLSYRSRVSDLEDHIVRLQDACMERNDSLAVLIQELRINYAVPPFLDKVQVEYLKKRGLNNPVTDLRDDLIANPDLICISGVLGGRMGFFFRDGIQILNRRWVFAYFEDGHIEGSMLLKYEIGENGKISWDVLDELNKQP